MFWNKGDATLFLERKATSVLNHTICKLADVVGRWNIILTKFEKQA